MKDATGVSSLMLIGNELQNIYYNNFINLASQSI